VLNSRQTYYQSTMIRLWLLSLDTTAFVIGVLQDVSWLRGLAVKLSTADRT
jgi:hypothetical protein